MSELERLHQARMARQAEMAAKPKKHRDPTKWHPKGTSDNRVQREVHAEQMRSRPLNFGTLTNLLAGGIEGIEATAKRDLVAAMDRADLTPDERGIRVHWQLVVEGYGWKMPEGYVHPEADDDLKAEGRSAWKRCVEMASDSLAKSMWVALWPVRRALPTGSPSLERKVEFRELPAPEGSDDILDAEVVDDECNAIDIDNCSVHGRWAQP